MALLFTRFFVFLPLFNTIEMETLHRLASNFYKKTKYNITELPQSGSNRRYFRITPEDYPAQNSTIGVIGESVEENKAFISISKTFSENGIPVPKLIAHSSDMSCYLQEDLGQLTLFDAIASGRKSGSFNSTETELLKKTIYLLPIIQHIGPVGFDFNDCYPIKEFDRQSIFFDLNYFKYCYLKGTGVEFDEVRLERDFEKFAEELLLHNGDTFMYRDFQSRNVMITEGEPYFIDFQGGRKGPIYYDVASFLWQAKANIPESLRSDLIDIYLDSLSTFKTIKRRDFIRTLHHFVLFRLLQVLGAYGFRGKFERKEHFLMSIPAAINSLDSLLEEGFDQFPYLCDVLKRMINRYNANIYNHPDGKSLYVRIFSFSYKKGIPEDISGNGGGYIFDCRALPNPGRETQYRNVTGMDTPVIDFFAQHKKETEEFFESVFSLADKHIENYLERGFTDLQFSFGCTGGQHRSVYCAEKLAKHLHEKYNIRICLCHREQRVEKRL